MIPKLVHQLWLDPAHKSNNPVPKDIARNIASWDEHHPEAEHRIWTLSNFEDEFTSMLGGRLMAAISVARFPTMQSNLIRLALLIRFGGFWSDLKNVVDRPFLDEITHHDLVLVEHQPMPNPRPQGYLTNSFVGAIPEHPFLTHLLEEGVRGVERREEGSLSKVTGLVLLNNAMKRAKKNETVPEHFFMDRQLAWEKCMHRVGASYQSGGRHWSKLQTEGSLYLDVT